MIFIVSFPSSFVYSFTLLVHFALWLRLQCLHSNIPVTSDQWPMISDLWPVNTDKILFLFYSLFFFVVGLVCLPTFITINWNVSKNVNKPTFVFHKYFSVSFCFNCLPSIDSSTEYAFLNQVRPLDWRHLNKKNLFKVQSSRNQVEKRRKRRNVIYFPSYWSSFGSSSIDSHFS